MTVEEEELVDTLRKDLHDLCQPLSALQCHLQLGQMSGSPEDLTDAVSGGLSEMERVLNHIDIMRRRLRRAEPLES